MINSEDANQHTDLILTRSKLSRNRYELESRTFCIGTPDSVT